MKATKKFKLSSLPAGCLRPTRKYITEAFRYFGKSVLVSADLVLKLIRIHKKFLKRNRFNVLALGEIARLNAVGGLPLK